MYRTISSDVVDVLVVSIRHVAEIREYDKTREETRTRVDTDSRQTVSTYTHTHSIMIVAMINAHSKVDRSKLAI